MLVTADFKMGCMISKGVRRAACPFADHVPTMLARNFTISFQQPCQNTQVWIPCQLTVYSDEFDIGAQMQVSNAIGKPIRLEAGVLALCESRS